MGSDPISAAYCWSIYAKTSRAIRKASTPAAEHGLADFKATIERLPIHMCRLRSDVSGMGLQGGAVRSRLKSRTLASSSKVCTRSMRESVRSGPRTGAISPRAFALSAAASNGFSFVPGG